MPSTRTRAIASHVEAAKRLLRELEQHAETALSALGSEGGTEFVEAVSQRDKILAQLDVVVEALSQERLVGEGTEEQDAMSGLFAEMAQAAAAALESHNQLTSHARRERDRLAAALERTNRPDPVAHQYAAAAAATRSRTLSVTG